MSNIFHISRILGLTAVSFVFALAWRPALSYFLRKYRVGKKIRAEGAPIFTKMHKKKEGTLTMGGILIWVTVLAVTLICWGVSKISPSLAKINFLTRSEILLPLGALVASALIGAGDDLLGLLKLGGRGMGLKVRHRLLVYTGIAIFGAWWFYFKLDWDLVHIPFVGDFNIGWWYVLVFIFILVATAFSVNETDGLDGLAGGILLIAFGAYGVIAFAQGRMDLATFCGVIIGSLLAFLWYNIYPAHFFMGDTGAMSLGITLGIIAMLTNAFLLLPFIGLILVVESVSVIIQMTSRKLLGRKVFIVTPIHHHFEAKGWPETQITMRFWIVNGIAATVGVILVFLERML